MNASRNNSLTPLPRERQSRRQTPKRSSNRHKYTLGLIGLIGTSIIWLSVLASQRFMPSIRDWWNGHDRELVAAVTAHVDCLVDATEPVWRDPDVTARLLATATELDTRHQLKHSRLRERKAQWTPARSLAADITAGIVTHKQQGLVWSCDLAVTDAKGRHVDGLNVRDFRIESQGQRFMRFAVEEATVAAARLNVAVAIDCSTSATGDPHNGAVSGACRLAESLKDRAQLRLWSFANVARAEGPWSSSVPDFMLRAKALQPNGHTALLQALDAAVSDLASQEGRRVLVVFSDGRDTIGGADAQSVLRRCKDHQVSIHAVVLKTLDIDVPLLQQLTTESKGQLFLVNDPGKLVSSFQSVVQELMKPAYHITLLLDEASTKPERIMIGQDPAVTIAIP